ncbi:MAG TPA: Mur ligase family protein [Gemmataceae bacterium]|nr:Mur ligase family protein [Gemmataceae bacterium]
MEFRKVLALRGPNIWAQFPVLEAWLDLGALKDSPSDQLPGFNQRLMTWLPSLIEHRCSEGVRGGFFQRLRTGTWQGHILEHVALELQTLAGTPVGFGRTRESATAGVYKVVVECDCEELGLAALEVARRLCLAAVHDVPFDVAGEIGALRELWRRVAPTPETAAIVKAANKRRIPVHSLNGEELLQLGHGVWRRRLRGALTEHTSAVAESVAGDYHLTRSLLQAVGVPVTPGAIVRSAAEAWEAAEDLGLPVTIRPRYGDGCPPEGSRLETQAQVLAAFQAASADGDPVLIERVVSGSAWRLLVLAGRVVAAVQRVGGQTHEVSPQVHPQVAARAAESARVVGLDTAGIDLVAEDIGRPLEEQGGVVRAVHARPALEEFLRPTAGEPRPVAEALLAGLFPEGHNGRIPLVSVTGTNGKTTTTRLTAHILGRVYCPVGMTCSEGIYLGDRLIAAGDCTGPKSARAVLQHPAAAAAVLETARGGILREGLGFDRCHVAVITNIGKADHLGLSDIQTPAQVAQVKRTTLEVVLPGGAAVLNANDPLVAALAESCRRGVIYFALDGNHPVLVQHRTAGQRVAFVRHNEIMLAEAERELPLVSLGRVPLTHGGRVGFNVENSLAAASAAWAVGIPLEQIRSGLETFAAVLNQVPGRFNLLDYHGATVVIDYAHNISALEYVIEVLKQFPHTRRSAIYAVPGDRQDDVIMHQGELLAGAYDRVILYEDTELRGRQDGEIFALMRRGMAAGRRVREILEVRGNLKATDAALAGLRPGELLVVQPEFPDVTAAYFSRLLGAGAREITLEEAFAQAAALATDIR